MELSDYAMGRLLWASLSELVVLFFPVELICGIFVMGVAYFGSNMSDIFREAGNQQIVRFLR